MLTQRRGRFSFIAISLGLSVMAIFAVVLLLSLNMVAAQTAVQLLVPVSIFALLCTSAMFWHIRGSYIRPLETLKEWSDRIRRGDLATPIPVPQKGGLNGLITDINSISRELSSLTEEMDTKVRAQTEHIAAKSRSLEILYDIATDLSTARNLDEMLAQFLETLLILVDAKGASVRLRTNDGHTQLVASLGLAPQAIKHEQRQALDRCLCGQITSDGGIGIQAGVSECKKVLGCNVIDGPCAEMIVVPVQYRDNILGVYNLFLKRPSAELGKDVRDLLNSIGKHLGLAIEKAHLDDNERRLSIMEERNSIGNELHDSLAQSLVSMRLQVKMLGELLYKKDIRSAEDQVSRLRTAIDDAHDSLRDLLANFKSRMDEGGLVPALDELVLRFREETGIVVFLQNEWHEFAFSPVQEVQVYRIIQEALTNVRKHSGALNVRILLKSSENDMFDVMIEDDGSGMDHEDTGSHRPGENIGVIIMKERAQKLGGTLNIDSEPGEGTRVYLTFPANPAHPQRTQLENESPHARSAY